MFATLGLATAYGAIRRNSQAHPLVGPYRQVMDLVIYPDEGHRFRAASAIEDSVTRELAFYGRVLGFTPAP